MPESATSKISYLHATTSYAKQIHDLQTEIYAEQTWFVGNEAPSIAKIELRIRYLDANQSLYLIAKSPAKICGWLELHKLRFDKMKHVASFTLAVSKHCRQQGIASQLLSKAFDWSCKHEVNKLSLNVRAQNQAAINLYEKLGFELEGREKQQIKTQTGFEDNLLMAKFLRTSA